MPLDSPQSAEVPRQSHPQAKARVGTGYQSEHAERRQRRDEAARLDLASFELLDDIA